MSSTHNATKAQIEADVQALREAVANPIDTVLGMAGVDTDGSGGGGSTGDGASGPGSSFDADQAAAIARDVGPKVAAVASAVGLVAGLARRSSTNRTARREEARKRADARIRAEELARAFGGMSPLAAAQAQMADDQERDAAATADEDQSGGGGKLVLVLVLAAAAGAAAAWASRRS